MVKDRNLAGREREQQSPERAFEPIMYLFPCRRMRSRLAIRGF